MRKLRVLIVALIFALGFGSVGLTGCASFAPGNAVDEVCEADPTAEVCVEGISAEVRYYALVSDYVRVKGAAVAYAEAPTTPRSHIEKILTIAEEADAVLKDIDAQRRAGEVSNNKYVTASRMLRAAVIRLSALTVAGGVIQ